ncbi:FAD-dependent oxidoreductase [Amycolatopsis sp. CA-128772]|uniref:flavin monoamine oxidase family protein n=1 Tax=Amycolatopsis sp. CA-128772 TaxID=2073159 RepID=UPI000CCFE089|nr:FAD-dependent oxidoreductase [Amycolatopsis sp. CA-128772]
MTRVLVVGAGPAGLAATTALAGAGYDVRCLEARDRVGGRILGTGPFDLGTTWFWDGESRVGAWVARLGLGTFPQHLAGNAVFQDAAGVQVLRGNPIDVPAHRYTGGGATLAAGIAAGLAPGVVRLNTPVTAIRPAGDLLEVATETETHHAHHVVLAVPPALAARRIDFGGALPADLLRLASATPVWMGAVAKVVAGYADAFWRRDRLAGAAYSRVGPLEEIHDMSGPDGDPAALLGFAPAALAGPGFEEAVVDQLARLFGPAARRPVALHVRDWSREEWTSPSEVDRLTDYGLFGHPGFRRPALEGRLHWASTETATDYAGHVEGALAAGQRAAEAVTRHLAVSHT